MFNCDVLIVGGGPVGLFLAAELGQRGVSVQLCDNKPGTSVHPAANAIARGRWSIFAARYFPRCACRVCLQTMPDIAHFTSIAGHELAACNSRHPPMRSGGLPIAYTAMTAEPPHRCSQSYIEPIY